MKIALFHTTLPEPGRKPGGVEVAVHRLANELARNEKDQVTVLSLTPKPADAEYAHRQLFSSWPTLRDNQLLRLFVLPLLLNKVRLSAFDVVHLHGDDWFIVSRPAATVRTMHGSALYEARTATSWKRKLSQYLVYPLEQLAVKWATRSLAIGPRTAEIYKIPDLANNGVNLDRFFPAEKSPHPQVLYVGTWEGRKRGQFMFDQFVNHVLPECPEAELIMVCDHQPQHAQVRNVHFPDDETLAGLYRTAWVFAYPSVYEGFGIPYIEAMASGTAVLCSPNDGAEYVLESGTFGRMVTDDLFASSLTSLLKNADEREALVKKGLERAQTFSWKAVAAQHRAVYEQAMREHAGGAADSLPVEKAYEL